MRTIQVDVRWRPEGSPINCAYDKEFRGQFDAMLAEALAHIDRNYLTPTTIKQPDKAESTRFWNFSLSDIEASLRQGAESFSIQDEAHVLVNIGYHSIQIRSTGDSFLICVSAHPLTRAPRQEAIADALP